MAKYKIISLAPGRTCLFGDHQDYIGLPVITCAINRYICLEALENNSDILHIKTPDIQSERSIHIHESIEKVEAGDHLLSALKVLRRNGCTPNKGYDITIKGNIPINAGISSSSALVVAWVRFLLEAYGSSHKVDSEFVAQMAYEAEVLEHGAPGGKMDQYSIGLGNVLYLETDDSQKYEVLNLPIRSLIIGESGIPKQTIGVLEELRKGVWQAIKKVKKSRNEFEIKTAKKRDLDKLLTLLPEELQPYLYAAICNHDVTQRALRELKQKQLNYHNIGSLMNEHHHILRDVLNISLPLIEDMIAAALDSGAFGAKIVGSGRGGSIVVLAPEGQEQQIINAVLTAGAKDAYQVEIDSGVRILSNQLETHTI